MPNAQNNLEKRILISYIFFVAAQAQGFESYFV